MNKMIRMLVCLILSLALLFSATSCTVDTVAQEIAGSVADGSSDTDVSSNGGSTIGKGSTVSTDHKTKTEDKEIAVTDNNNQSFITVTPPTDKSDASTDEGSEKYTEIDSGNNFLTDEELEDFMVALREYEHREVFSIAGECIAFDLHEAIDGEVFQALAIVGDEMIPGLAFTEYTVLEKTSETTIYSCGFIQLIDPDSDVGVSVTREDVERGVAVVPYGEYNTSTGFIIGMGAAISSFSGILNNLYFRYDQVADYAVSITIEENDRSVYDESIDLYNFDRDRYVFKGDMSYSSTDAYPYLTDEAKAYATARSVVEQIIEYQNSNHYNAETETIIIFTEDAVEEYMLNSSQQGTINGFLIEELNNIELEANQFLVVTADGVNIETVVDTDALAKERTTNGIIGLIGSALLVAGSIFVTVATCGAGAPVAITAIAVVTGASATLYSVSQMISSVSDIYYGSKGDITSESINPVLDCFKKAIGDDEKATKIYHLWGISSSVVQALVNPANAALSLSRAAGASVWQTTIAITRAVAVEAVKMATTGLVSMGVGYGTTMIVTNITGNSNIGKLVGFGTTLVAGFLTYRGLNKLDAKYNFSGLHSKPTVVAAKEKQPIREFKNDDPNMSADDYRALDDEFVPTSKTRHEVKNQGFKDAHKGEEWYKVYEDGYIVKDGEVIKYSRHYFEKADGSHQFDIKFYKGRVSNK